MKTKSFLLFSTSVFATSLFLIVFHSQQPQSIQNIVTQTHQHIKDFQQVNLSPQDNLRDVEENHLVAEERYFRLLGLDGHTELWHNTTVPAIVTYARGDDHAMAVSFVRAAAKLPYTVLLYNLGLKPHSLALVSSYCNSSKCAIIELDLEVFPSHVSDESITAFRPLIIQRWAGGARALAALWARAARGGVLAWARRAAVTSLTHPRMFSYLQAAQDDFLFVQMLEPARLLLADTPAVRDLMRVWKICAQSGGCRFDKKPQYRYSGCHGQDASALSIILGLRSGFEEGSYVVRDAGGAGAARGLAARAGGGGAARVNASSCRKQTDK
ncbi:hypothetical protein MSG28_003737 [Choristoneura fumiferana]|uniref:Uncharacterized protein n=1 Tax=Choristoneura fumiferana TaxID=7141 RepID=A0ACC0KGI3_CHOFU|nr:hypothetical protein MSG28_003737 [Choristoneura fumiferana]